MRKINKIIEKTVLKEFISEKYYERLKILTVSTKEHFHYSEKESSSLFFIIDGFIQLKQTTKDGKYLNYLLMQNFNVFGEQELLFNEKNKIDFYTLKDKTKILEIPFDISIELIKNDKFKIFLLELHSKKMQEFIMDISILHFLGINKFLARQILKFAKKNIFKFKNISFLSEVLNIDRKSLYNAIKVLEKEELIVRENNLIRILNKNKIKKYLEI